MSAFKDSAIKLFGKTIPLFSVHLSSLHQSHQLSNQESSGNQEEETTTSSSSGANKKPKTSSPETAEIESLIQTTPKKIGEEGKGKEKTLKKPDKILACPRCNSMDTKFCYYNNYNVNQPRHMCKKCQRYWTAGGTMRNVPVGAGRRKNKNSTAAHFRHTFVQASINGLQYPCFVNNNSTTFLTFGSDRTDNLLDREQVQVVGNQRFIDQVPYVSSANFVVPNGLFNGFSHAKSHDRSSSLLLLQANPAALHRSLNFHERN